MALSSLKILVSYTFKQLAFPHTQFQTYRTVESVVRGGVVILVHFHFEQGWFVILIKYFMLLHFSEMILHKKNKYILIIFFIIFAN